MLLPTMHNATARARLFLGIILLAAASAAAHGQASTFDIAAFTPPAGWQQEMGADHVTYTQVDNQAGTFCMFAVYSSQPAPAEPSSGFAAEWQALVGSSFASPVAPAPARGVTLAGQPFLAGSAAVSRGNTPYVVELVVMLAATRLQSVLVVAPTERVLGAYQPALADFLASFRYPAQAAAAPKSAPSPTDPASAPPKGAAPPDLGSIKGKGIVGVWMGFKTVMGKYEPEPRWVTFYDDGQVLKDIPREGLDGFDRRASKADENQAPYWATFSWDGKSGSITTPGVRYPIPLKAKSANQIYLDSDVYYRCVEVDGLRLQGSWTTFSDPNDPALDQPGHGRKPLITFTRDGRFADEGVFASYFDAYSSTDPQQSLAGTGTYELKRFSVILHYADGRNRKLAITGVFGGNPAPSAQIIFLSRGRFNLRK
jgi:hypothetical protein